MFVFTGDAHTLNQCLFWLKGKFLCRTQNQAAHTSISHVTSPEPSLPLFDYGALKPSEIGWDFISAEVSHWIEATAEGVALTVSDGVAFARFLNGKSISGALLHFSQPMVSYEKVALFEGLGHKNPRHKWQRVNTVDKAVHYGRPVLSE